MHPKVILNKKNKWCPKRGITLKFNPLSSLAKYLIENLKLPSPRSIAVVLSQFKVDALI
jgi:hypothetical protein